LEGTILEGIGVAICILIGLPISRLVGYRLGMKAGFHLLPVVPIATAFLFDLYFAMEENCKIIANLTPISAIRGEYRIRKEKLKIRRKSIFGKLFGIEGDYAYKSIMRNPLRFYKTVSAMGIGIAATITTMGFVSTMNGMLKDFDELFKYYKVFVADTLPPWGTIEEVQSLLPGMDLLQAIADMKEVDAAKQVYSCQMLLVNWEEYYGHFTEALRTETAWGVSFEEMLEQAGEDSDLPEWAKQNFTESLPEVTFTGYDEEDYARYESVLTEGTLDISENGVVLINGGEEVRAELADSIMDDSMNKDNYMKVTYTDYKVGDTIDVIDMAKYRSLYAERQEAILRQYEKDKTLFDRMQTEPKEHFSDEEWEAYQQYLKDIYGVSGWVCKRMLEEGAYKTYTIEGIVEDEVNRCSCGPIFILPLEKYFAATATDESMMVGMNYHFTKFSAKHFYETLERDVGDTYSGYFGGIDWWLDSPYPEYVARFEEMQGGFRILMLVAGFIVMMSTFNILNTTASNLHLRRKEFAQLRVIGVSGRQLMRMVMLEGIISTIVANLVGIVTGVVIHRVAFDRIYEELYQVGFRFPWAGAALGLLFSTLILCGSIYVPLRSLKLDMAGDLATGGE
ncbi:MAG: ABC transporter permease, partial [Lachnospiraceae bacterium]|nr:ABC transporter permease [Lachnospiraceae bacterium]